MRRRATAGAVYVVLLALVVTGCGHSSLSTTDQVRHTAGRSPEHPTPLTAVQAPPPSTPEEEVTRVGLRSREIPSSQRVRWPAVGRSTTGPTLAVCPTPSAADRHRMARRTVTAATPHSPVVYADQTLAYDSAASGRAAYEQVRRVVATCSTSPPGVLADAALPVEPSYAVTWTLGGAGRTSHALLVAQQRGDVLDLLTLTSPRALSERQLRLALREARATGNRLARLPLASTGA